MADLPPEQSASRLDPRFREHVAFVATGATWASPYVWRAAPISFLTMRVLITGGAGFIGSHLARRCLSLGHDVRVVDNLSSGKRANLDGVLGSIEFVEADIREASGMVSLARGREIVFHEAALVSVPYSVEHPQETHDVNLQGTLNVLEAARAAGARRVVFASSAAIYGDDPDLPKSENMRPAPVSPYGVEKLASEHYCAVYSRLYGLETVALRYFNVFGPRQDPSSPYSGVISIFVDRALRGEPPTIFGDGLACRDFVFVDNVVDANIGAMVRPGVSGGVFNIACGVRTTLNDLSAMLARIVGKDVTPRYADPRAGDIVESVANIDRARAALGYAPQVGVDDGLRQLVEFVRSNRPTPP
jgi:nucleoside-diphosphate-sugar epimerase